MALRNPHRSFFCTLTLSALVGGPSLMVACGAKHNDPPAQGREEGQSEFVSAPPNGASAGRSSGAEDSAGGAPASDAGTATPVGGGATTTTTRKVEETDLYRLEGDRLFYLNAYRGLMVFDVSDVVHPKLMGRSPIYGQPVEMLVRGSVASIVVADWYGKMDDGSPFHGSIVRQIDATDPAHMKVNGEAKLGGWVRDVRVVGDVLYAVSEDYGWYYGWDGYYGDGVAGTSASTGPKVVVSSVAFGGGAVKQMGTQSFDGYGGVFNVTQDAILLAHDEVTDPSKPWDITGRTVLQYIDIRDPAGTIKLRGDITVDGRIQGWGADNGRWNLDFADEHYAHTIGCGDRYCGGAGSHFVLATVDFENPDAPVLRSKLDIPGTAWTPTARFDNGRMYLSPSNGYWYDGTSAAKTPVQIFDISNPAAPALAGSTEIEGAVWLFMPSGNRLFALGNEYDPSKPYYGGSKVSLRYIDVTNAAAPSVIGTSTFGDGWAWTPAAGTFKAFTKDDKQGLVVLPFSGWSSKDGQYNNGLQLIEFSDTSINTSGTAKTRGWVERGIFVKGKLVSLSDIALSVVDYTDRANPKVVADLTLARNVIDAQPNGTTIAQLSSDWWDNDLSKSEMRVLPLSDAEENKSLDGALASVNIEGYNARVFRNGDLAYVVSDVREKVACPATGTGGPGVPTPSGDGTGSEPVCWSNTQKVQIVDLAGGKATLRGSVKLPKPDGYGYWGWGWYGCYAYDWYNGADVVQVGGDALAFRRWYPVYSYGADGSVKYEEAKNALYVVDLHNADAPTLASTAVTTDPYGWWGNMRVSGNQLYVSHYEWLEKPDPTAPAGTKWYVKYFLDPVDLTDRTAPKLGARINVPGIMVGASQTDPSIVYTVDYRWYGDAEKNDFSVVKIIGDKAYLQGTTTIDGWVGQVVVQGNKAYASAEHYYDPGMTYSGPRVQLHEIDITDPKSPIDRASTEKKGWGWLLGVVGDRAIITSGWSGAGIDIYKLSDGAPPVFDEFVRTRGWWANSLSRQGNSLFLASGYWGVQQIDLK
ncbi:MAG: beta-propeller domain-containing protein [Polyangiales bacterium]